MSNETHELIVTGPHASPTGRNGWYFATCSCGKYAGHWGDNESRAARPAREHIKAKVNAEAIQERRTQAQFRSVVLNWIDGDWNHQRRPDLATKMRKGEEVTLSYRDLYDLVNTVRYNAQQR